MTMTINLRMTDYIWVRECGFYKWKWNCETTGINPEYVNSRVGSRVDFWGYCDSEGKEWKVNWI